MKKGIQSAESLRAQAEMLGNRVRKNFEKLRGPFAQRGIEVFRLYDRDIPEVRAVVDYYAGEVVLGEYARTQTDDPAHLPALAQAVASALQIDLARVHVKQRRTRPAAGPRYERLARTGERKQVREGDLRFLVNLDDYIDTGLFADHRETRALVRAESAGARFLNLFAYTGSFTCAAALGGARETATVDASETYLDWARDNLALNGLAGERHAFFREDARAFLARVARERRTFTLCVVDPPTFSDGFDVGRDHRALVEQRLALLEPGGVLWFSTNHQRFEPDLAGLPAREVRERTARTVPADYRNKQVHRSFRLVK
ncbi:MAG: class I SAM-dependent methyltransferase [Myxococcales bacterium]